MEKAANLAASLTDAEAVEAAPKKVAADKASRGASFQFYRSRELRCRFSEMEAPMGGNGKTKFMRLLIVRVISMKICLNNRFKSSAELS